MEIVIGYQGREHITASQLGRIIAGMAGDGTYVLDTQEKLAATLQTANQVRIATGDLVFQGRVATVEVPETLTITNGVTGQKRNDLIVARYSKEASSGKESCVLAVVKGTAVSYGDPADPSFASGSILDGDSPVEVPLYRIPIDGLTPGTPVKLIEDAPSIDSLRETVSQNPKVVAGSLTRSPSRFDGGSVLVWTPSEFEELTGYSAAEPGGQECHASVSLSNGDATAQPSNLIAAQWLKSGWWAVFETPLRTSSDVRINYVIAF